MRYVISKYGGSFEDDDSDKHIVVVVRDEPFSLEKMEIPRIGTLIKHFMTVGR